MTQDIALLKFEGKIYYAKSAPHQTVPPFFSAPALLIQKIYETEPQMARKILRNRIFTNVATSASLQGIVKVAAKRITTQLEPDSAELELPGNSVDLSGLPSFTRLQMSLPPEPKTSEREWMDFALSLISPVACTPQLRFQRDRPVAALLVSRENQLLAAAINTNSSIRTQHAEMNLLRDYHERTGGPPPLGSTILTTLKPCKMCAGMICDFSNKNYPDSIPRVIFYQDDPGPNAAMTALDLQNPPIQFKL